ncbi:class I SAM-dependent methyltransferase [Dawidia soli]|uniref:Methyltransferase domain-containing protein n=1 Tax=Dawidia soli TaxID=2782352 RepID=A0AAP2DH31_9BACT|nr:methyltransferase domain-containing protein [Dawidia soli]MBT1690565.1 methyltransferase domain-containing protein [Dawidia soli]
MTVREHYDNHLGNIYAWMVGDFASRQQAFQDFLVDQQVVPASTGIALDLGAGHGLQAVSLARQGFAVTAVDFNDQLLQALAHNTQGLTVGIVKDDLRQVHRFAHLRPELIICWGDTLTHLDSRDDIAALIRSACSMIAPGGLLMLSFRDYTTPLTGDSRFIPVKSDDTRILTCILDYEPDSVRVTDLLHTKTSEGWQQQVSSYRKVRIAPAEVVAMLESSQMTIRLHETIQRMATIIAVKSKG